MARAITISDFDKRRLLSLIEGYETDALDRGSVYDLIDEIERARVVAHASVPSDVITMNTRVRVTDLGSGAQRTVTIVFPGHANADEGKISILAPLGTALIGYRVGDTVEWEVPAGVRKLRIDAIEYQPEAAGDFRL